jgi:hypothetical protein
MVTKPLQVLLKHAIDYAGLFPPANLDMPTAITNYATYRQSNDAWMLGRFICPASRLIELNSYKETLFNTKTPFEFSILGSSGKNKDQFMAQLEKDIQRINIFCEFHGSNVKPQVYETRLPDDLTADNNVSEIGVFIREVAQRLTAANTPSLIPFFETSLKANWQETVESVARAITAYNLELKHADPPEPKMHTAGFKMRCGGVEPHMYPEINKVAKIIYTCLRLAVPLKATAGLHHPIRHFNDTAGVKMHGFLNVMGAMLLGDVHSLELEEIEEILADEDAGNFIFTQRAFAWQGLRASTSDILKFRENGFISFGSCSFDEPREDLINLKLL